MTSDVDSSKFAQHHTLGLGANQASPGSHTHNGADSSLIAQINDNSLMTEYTPAWVSTGTQPAINDGTLRGFYVRTGMWCFFTLEWNSGSGTTYGSGLYSFSMPFPVIAGPWFAAQGVLKNGNSRWPINGLINTADSGRLYRLTPASGKTEGLITDLSIGSTGWKTAWAANDFMLFTGQYIIDLGASPA